MVEGEGRGDAFSAVTMNENANDTHRHTQNHSLPEMIIQATVCTMQLTQKKENKTRQSK